MADNGRAMVYLRTADGQPLRDPSFPAADLEDLARRIWQPWQDLVADEVDRLLAEYGACYIVDAHSFPKLPLACELHRDPALRCDICLGWDEFHGPPHPYEGLPCLFRPHYSVGFNRPFSGAFVPARHFQRDARVRSVMVEVHRGRYLDVSETTFVPEKAQRLQRCLAAALELLGADCHQA